MSREDMEPEDWSHCQAEGCHDEARVVSYESDEDAYEMVCDTGHRVWVGTSDETWK